jgi:hypothetical protein
VNGTALTFSSENAFGTFHPDDIAEEDYSPLLPKAADTVGMGLLLLDNQLGILGEAMSAFDRVFKEAAAVAFSKKDSENFQADLALHLASMDAGTASTAAPASSEEARFLKIHASKDRSTSFLHACEVTDLNSARVTSAPSMHDACFKGDSNCLDATAEGAQRFFALKDARRIKGRILGYQGTLRTVRSEKEFAEHFLLRSA